MVKHVCYIGYAGRLMGIHFAQQVKINFQLRVVGILHIIVNEKIGHNRGVHLIILVNIQTSHA